MLSSPTILTHNHRDHKNHSTIARYCSLDNTHEYCNPNDIYQWRWSRAIYHSPGWSYQATTHQYCSDRGSMHGRWQRSVNHCRLVLLFPPSAACNIICLDYIFGVFNNQYNLFWINLWTVVDFCAAGADATELDRSTTPSTNLVVLMSRLLWLTLLLLVVYLLVIWMVQLMWWGLSQMHSQE